MALIPAVALLPGCASSPKTPPATESNAGEMGGTTKAIVADNPAPYEDVVRAFVTCAIKNDVEGMVALTSKVTIAQLGVENLKKTYVRDTVPTLRYFPIMTGGGRADYVNDGKGANGWLFRRVYRSPAGGTANFQFVVLKEQDAIHIGSFGLWK
jgi:hypothetical protein